MNIKLARKVAHMTQKQLAQKAGVDPSLISRLERGQRPHASHETVIKIARALGVEAADLAPVPDDRKKVDPSPAA
jgi:transcriptional regulator with XRE-family HTH domain